MQDRHDSILIKRDGKPVAALVDARLFERIEAGDAAVPEAEGLAETMRRWRPPAPGADHSQSGRGA